MNNVPENATPVPVPVPSPCTGVCRLSPVTGLCEGCLRTIDEIIGWREADDDAKHAVWRNIHRRRAGEII